MPTKFVLAMRPQLCQCRGREPARRRSGRRRAHHALGQEAAFRAGVGASGALAGVCGNEPMSRGIYQLQFALTKAELWVRYGWGSSVMVNVG